MKRVFLAIAIIAAIGTIAILTTTLTATFRQYLLAVLEIRMIETLLPETPMILLTVQAAQKVEIPMMLVDSTINTNTIHVRVHNNPYIFLTISFSARWTEIKGNDKWLSMIKNAKKNGGKI